MTLDNFFKKHIQYSLSDNVLRVEGTNQIMDIIVSMMCIPSKSGDHLGCNLVATWLWSQIEQDIVKTKQVHMHGHSMGGSIGQALGKIIVSSIDATVYVTSKGGFPALRHGYRHDKLIITERVHSNDPVPSLFPWFGFGCDPEYFGDDRKWYLVLYQFTQFVQSKGDHVTGY